MSDSERQTEVLIEKEGRVLRWGQHAYFRTWNGLKETLSAAALKAIALPIAVLIGVLTFVFSSRKDSGDARGRQMNVPNIVQDLPIANAPILNGRGYQGRDGQRGWTHDGAIRVVRLGRSAEIPVGSEAKAILESGASNGIVKARLLTALKVDGEILLPERTSLFGRGKSSEERLFIQFHKAIYPTGETTDIRGQAFDVGDKILGLKGAFVGTRTKKMAMALGFGVLGGMADGLQSNSSGSNVWGMPEQKSLRDSALSGASKAAIDQSQGFMEETKNAPNIIEVKRGTEFFLITDEPKREDKQTNGIPEQK